METTHEELAFLPGSTFENHYEIVEKIGEGGFGSIFKARQLTTGQEVALKVMRSLARDDPSRMDTRAARFLREARLCARLRHPHIVPIVDSGQTASGCLYTVFTFVPGENLASLLAREGALAPPEARHLMLQVLDALACAHALGVIHRDLKPSNIMVSATGARRNALVLDFGIGVIVRATTGEALTRLTATSDALGTPGYGAPEQWQGREPSPRADVFSWGLVFLECLTGAPVYSGASEAELFYELLGPKHVPMPAVLERHPLGALITRAVRKDVSVRDLTARELFDKLDACDLRQLSRDAMQSARPAAANDAAKTASTLDTVSPHPERERRQVTVLACVLSGASPLGTGARAHDDRDTQLRAELAVAAEIARHHGGHIAAAVGDQLLIYFGYPQAAEDDAQRSAHAALELLSAFETRADQTCARIALHTGFIVAHPEGDAALAAGSAAQLASELARRAPRRSAVVSADAYKLLRRTFSFEPNDDAGSAHERFRLGNRLATTAPSPEAGPCFGRKQELGLLLERWSRSRAGDGRSSLVIGDPGIGKSRLIRELRAQLSRNTYTFVEGRCTPETQNHSLCPIADLLARALGLDREPSPIAKITRLEAELERYGVAPVEAMPVFLRLFSLPSDGTWAPLDGPAHKHKDVTLSGILTLIFALAEHQPVLLVVEDLHWADPTTLELLGQMVREAPSAPLCVVLTTRPELAPAFPAAEVLQVRLDELDRHEIEAMVGNLVGATILPPPVIDQMISRSDGVPLFVEELTRTMMDSRLLVERADRYELAGSLLDMEIPSTLRGLFTARLDRLGRARDTAQLAAVLGREHSVDVLTAVSTMRPTEVTEDLDRLMDAGLVSRKRSAKDAGAMFKHALVRDAAYESLASGARQRLHARIASVLEERFPAFVEAKPELLAHHWTAAGFPERAAPYRPDTRQGASGAAGA